jgi:lipopolysaccharide transport system permease protein
MQIFLRCNIIGDYVEMVRDIVLYDLAPSPLLYIGTVLASLLIFRSSYRFFMRYKNVFVDVI